MRILRRLTRAEHADPRDRPENALIEFEDDAGSICHGFELDDEAGGKIVVKAVTVTAGPALASDLATVRVANDALATKVAQNRARLNILARKAARHAKDAANPALTTREINEAIARLWFAEKTEDAV